MSPFKVTVSLHPRVSVSDFRIWTGFLIVLLLSFRVFPVCDCYPDIDNITMPPLTGLLVDEQVRTAPAPPGSHVELDTPVQVDVVKLPIVFVMGGPGSGKGTQCALIKERFGYTHLSTGDLLRDEVNSGSPRGAWLNGIMLKGDLVPLDTVLTLLKEAILREAPKSKGYLIDGFPREVAQAVAFEKQVGVCSMVIYFEVPFDIMTERLIERGKTSGRLDDNVDTIRKRLQTFADQTIPVVEHYKTINKTFVLNANRSIDAVFEDVTQTLKHIKV
ncbi:adenylate kinase isoenzyme 1-like [Paramacrobiotus metropolitanus]|uniref:adenylate kinase isoenzyme 1-like n=1 Tax=Paramacrobiotus metropolitanus TaxID=2943436 RepID=UPI00244627AB|nr:adenylate kinase isoenzyme 1-like [Paramacrobiotus metropolitanus]